ncbi:MAG: 50S ribosomal protein L23 [Deltaproteobacteria bacterium]|nr:MAG: 50S ribosomal protein L23 [Deltaproteobacteria bacterium]
MDIFQIVKQPHITEKATLQKTWANQISFKVHKKANKIEIKHAVETLFKTKVVDVKTMNVRGKRRRVGRYFGKRPDWKKAVVTLAPGEDIELFEGV